MSEDFDYTKEDESSDSSGVPFRSPDEYIDQIEVYIPKEAQSAEETESSTFKPIEPGKHVLKVSGIISRSVDESGIPELQSFPVFVQQKDGSVAKRNYLAYSWRIDLCLHDKPNCQTSDYFKTLGPNPTADEMYAFLNGTSKRESAGDGRAKGFESKKLAQFMSRLGYTRDESGAFEPAAYRISGWKGRLIGAELQARDPMPKTDRESGEPLKDEHGRAVMYQPAPSVKMFSYFGESQAKENGVTWPSAQNGHVSQAAATRAASPSEPADKAKKPKAKSGK